MQTWQPAYIGIGSNLSDPRRQVERAFLALEKIGRTRLIARSALYGSHPLGPIAQPDFLNAAAGMLTQLEPLALLAELRGIEAGFGRPAARERWGPRILDLDLLVQGRAQLASKDLTLPHPGIAARNFVLYPLSDIAPDLQIPGLGRVAELKARVSGEGIWRLGDEPHAAQPRAAAVPGA